MLRTFFKRSFDILFSLLIMLFVFSWLYPILAFLIRLESCGPIFFTQLRSGRNGSLFKCYKFRSMYVNADAHRRQATRSDSRITRLGAVMRKTSMDELPQFFNVLIGHMSIVGPRPHMVVHTEEYSLLTDNYKTRHLLRPGITGWAQILGLRGEVKSPDAMLKRLDADVWYLKNWWFMLDLKIIFLTFWITLKGDKNAY